MNTKVYKCCAVPLCKNTSITTPNKVFVYVPNKKTMRAKWLHLARRDPAGVVMNSALYFCEDHFDLPNDMENYMQYHLMGYVSQVRMKPGCIPKNFACQDLSDTTAERPYYYIRKKRKMMVNVEREKQLEETHDTSGEKLSKSEAIETIHFEQICRVCLTTSERMFSLQEDHRTAQYEQVTGLSVGHEDGIPLSLCWECSHRLAACHKFRARARLAHCLMEDLLRSKQSITVETISQIDRKKLGFNTRLEQINIPPDYFDLKVDENENKIPVTSVMDVTENWETRSIKLETHVKIEPKNEPDEIYMEIETHNDTETHNGEKAHDETETHTDAETQDQTEIYNQTETVFIEANGGKENDLGGEKSLDEDDEELKIDTEVNNETIDKKAKENNSNKNDSGSRKTQTAALTLNEKIFEVKTLSPEEILEQFEKRKEVRLYHTARFRCELCYKGFMHEDAYNFHEQLHTDKNGLHECSVCKIRFSNRLEYTRHQITHQYLYKCKLCEFVAETRPRALAHQANHNGLTYQCQHCNKIYIKQSSLKYHVRLKHTGGHVCRRCGRGYVRQTGLEQHWARKHRFEEPVESKEEHPCLECDLKFETMLALHQHMCVCHPVDAILS